MGCLKTIKELNKDKYIFASSAKLILGAILVWWASIEIIGSFDYNTNYYYQFFNILVNSSYPLICMYIYVRTEINKLDNPKKTRSELRKKQFNDVEQFINSFANSEDLDDLKEKINKKRKKLEKEKFAGVKKIVEICDKRNAKRYVKKSATVKDLNSLEKTIAEKRDGLENNNDAEKHMD